MSGSLLFLLLTVVLQTGSNQALDCALTQRKPEPGKWIRHTMDKAKRQPLKNSLIIIKQLAFGMNEGLWQKSASDVPFGKEPFRYDGIGVVFLLQKSPIPGNRKITVYSFTGFYAEGDRTVVTTAHGFTDNGFNVASAMDVVFIQQFDAKMLAGFLPENPKDELYQYARQVDEWLFPSEWPAVTRHGDKDDFLRGADIAFLRTAAPAAKAYDKSDVFYHLIPAHSGVAPPEDEDGFTNMIAPTVGRFNPLVDGNVQAIGYDVKLHGLRANQQHCKLFYHQEDAYDYDNLPMCQGQYNDVAMGGGAAGGPWLLEHVAIAKIQLQTGQEAVRKQMAKWVLGITQGGREGYRHGTYSVTITAGLKLAAQQFQRGETPTVKNAIVAPRRSDHKAVIEEEINDECTREAFTFCASTAKVDRKYTFDVLKANGMKLDAAAVTDPKVNKELLLECLKVCTSVEETSGSLRIKRDKKLCETDDCQTLCFGMMPTSVRKKLKTTKPANPPPAKPVVEEIVDLHAPEPGCPSPDKYGLTLSAKLMMSPALIESIVKDWDKEFAPYGYELLDFLGKGATGVVFQVQTKDKNILAMKISFCKKLNGEIKTLNALRGKKGIVQYHADGVSKVAPAKWQFVVMEQTGLSLADLMGHNLILPAGFRRAMWLVLEILEELHSEKDGKKCFSHADIATRNIALQRDDPTKIVLIDYDLARECSAKDSNDIIKDYLTLHETISKCGCDGQMVASGLLRQTFCSPNVDAYTPADVNGFISEILINTDVRRGAPLEKVPKLHQDFAEKLKKISVPGDPTLPCTPIVNGEIPMELLAPKA